MCLRLVDPLLWARTSWARGGELEFETAAAALPISSSSFCFIFCVVYMCGGWTGQRSIGQTSSSDSSSNWIWSTLIASSSPVLFVSWRDLWDNPWIEWVCAVLFWWTRTIESRCAPRASGWHAAYERVYSTFGYAVSMVFFDIANCRERSMEDSLSSSLFCFEKYLHVVG